MLSSSKTFVSTVVFIVVLQLYGTCIHTAYALEDIADGLSQNISALQEGGIGMLGGFLTSCPLKATRLTPCLDTENDLFECESCITDFLTDGGILSNSTIDDDGNNSTNITSTGCDSVQLGVCSAVTACVDTCGVVTSDGKNGKIASMFQFGSNCESLFLDLVTCALEAKDIVTSQCSMETCNVNGTATSASSFSMSSTSAAISMMIASGVVSLL